MDKMNLQNALFLEVATKNDVLEVPDPYYGTEKNFEEVFQLLYQACETFSQQFKSYQGV
jgi:protein-tyrosine phosphatase